MRDSSRGVTRLHSGGGHATIDPSYAIAIEKGGPSYESYGKNYGHHCLSVQKTGLYLPRQRDLRRLSNSWDYGPLGVEFKNNVKKAWWKKFVQESPYNVGVDAAILMNPQVWVATGHVGGFSDPLMDCKDCKTRHRADKLIEDLPARAPTAGPTRR